MKAGLHDHMYTQLPTLSLKFGLVEPTFCPSQSAWPGRRASPMDGAISIVNLLLRPPLLVCVGDTPLSLSPVDLEDFEHYNIAWDSCLRSSLYLSVLDFSLAPRGLGVQ